MPRPLLPLAGACLLAVTAFGDLLSPAPASASQSRSEEEIGEIVRAYLLENPEVIFEAVEVYQQQQYELAQLAAEEAARDYLPELLSSPAGHILPATSGQREVVVVEFFDYNCGFCRRASNFVFELQDQNKDLAVVLQELPVTNPNSREPALAALAVAGSDDYVTFHRRMMNADGIVDGDRARVIANDLGIPAGLIDDALNESAAQTALHDRLDRSLEIANALGIDGTPAFLVTTPDGSFVKLIGGYDEAAVKAAIEAARAKS